MAGRLEGKVALITGVGGRQGREAVLRFCAEGAKVVGSEVSEAAYAGTAELARKAGADFVGFAPVDLSDPEQCRNWVEQAAAVHGRIDILYNNASRFRAAPLAEVSVEDWRYSMANEVDLVFYATRFAWPWLIKNGGVVLNTASVSGKIGDRHTPLVTHATTKAAVEGMTRQIAAEGAPYKVRAVSISPGFIDSSDGEMHRAMGADNYKTLLNRSLVGRAGLPRDVIALAVFLASDEASFITGTDFVVDGGMTTCA